MKILLLDNYDSFTYNLAHYLRIADLSNEVAVHRNDQIKLAQAADFDAFVLSPGPKRPADAGILMELIARFGNEKPMLGVCLGHQALGEHFGAILRKAALPMHGKTSLISHDGQDIYQQLPNPMQVMRYHSLILENLPDCLQATAQTPQGELMSLRHRHLPLWGVQYHPESVGSPEGQQLIANWVQTVKELLK